MSTLLLFLPARGRLRAQGRSTLADGQGRGAVGHDFDYLLTPDGHEISAQGSVPAAQLPHAETVIAIPALGDVAWRRVVLPRAGRQMRTALAGLLEESLLDEPDGLHFALEPETVGGDAAWVAITSRAWLAEQLAQLDAAHIFVDRVAPLAWPEMPPRGHFHEAGVAGGPVVLSWSHPDGVTELPLDGGLSRALFPASLVQSSHWSATPGVAEQAERWLGTAVTVCTPAQHALGVLHNPWNLRQFELAPRTRGIRALRLLYRNLMRRQWRPVRWGLAGLVAVQLLGLNVLALQRNQQLKQSKVELEVTLKKAFPQVRAVLDAPVQMRRETDALRASAGRAGEQDLEVLLAAAATAWPADRGPLEGLTFEPGRLTLSSNGWSDAQIQQFRSQLRSEGWQLDASAGSMVVSRQPRGATPDKT